MRGCTRSREAVRHRVTIEVLVKCILCGIQHAAQTTAREQRAGPAIDAETLHQCLILFATANHVPHFDLAGWSREHDAAACTADRANEAGFGQGVDDLVKVVAGNDEFARQGVGADVRIRRSR